MYRKFVLKHLSLSLIRLASFSHAKKSSQREKISIRTEEPSQTLQRLTILLRNSETDDDILLGNSSAEKARTECNINISRLPRVVLDGGTPEECVKMGEVVEKRCQKEAEDLTKRLDREKEQFGKPEMRLIKAGNSIQRQQQQEKKTKKQQEGRNEISAKKPVDKLTSNDNWAALKRQNVGAAAKRESETSER